jgi:hypothetical protein
MVTHDTGEDRSNPQSFPQELASISTGYPGIIYCVFISLYILAVE